MVLAIVDEPGVRFLEGDATQPFILRGRDGSFLIEACLSHQTRSALLYPRNLPERFFDLSSGEAGELLQKLRSFKVRLAIVCPPGDVSFSSRFSEIIADDFRIFDTRDRALHWLSGAST